MPFSKYSPKQKKLAALAGNKKKLAALAGNKKKITAADLKKLRKKKK